MFVNCWRKVFVPFGLVWILLNGICTAGVEVKGQYTTVRLWEEGTRGPFETDVNITVLVPPIVTVDGKAHVSDDSEVTLASCFASNSQPAADVMWRLGDLNDSLMTETKYMMHPDGTFTVVSHLLGAPLRHLNQKKIQCVVTHSTQRTKEYKVDHVINVHYPPELVMIIPDDPTEPKEFHCEADSNPRPSNYTWIKLNESTPHSHGDKLYVPKPASDLNGVYICKVSNQYGSASGVLYVNHQTESTWSCCSVCGFVFISIILCIYVVYIFQLKIVSLSTDSSILHVSNGIGHIHNTTPHDDHEMGNAWYDTLPTSCVKKHTLKRHIQVPKHLIILSLKTIIFEH